MQPVIRRLSNRKFPVLAYAPVAVNLQQNPLEVVVLVDLVVVPVPAVPVAVPAVNVPVLLTEPPLAPALNDT